MRFGIKKRICLVFVGKEKTRKPIILNVNVFILPIAVIAGIALFAFAGSGLTSANKEFFGRIAYSRAKMENEQLFASLHKLEGILENETEIVKNLSALETDLSLSYGFPRIDEDVKKLGIGGRLSFADKARLQIGSPLENHVAGFEEIISGNSRRIDFLKNRLEKIKEESELQKHYFAERPSIFPVNGRVTSEFGSRNHPILGKVSWHEGIDIANLRWMPIRATADGVCTYSGPRSGYGLLIEITHRRTGYMTRYAHLQATAIKVGDRVKRGDIIGSLGSSGLSTGPHVHYEVRKNDKAINPRAFLIGENVDFIFD